MELENDLRTRWIFLTYTYLRRKQDVIFDIFLQLIKCSTTKIVNSLLKKSVTNIVYLKLALLSTDFEHLLEKLLSLK